MTILISYYSFGTHLTIVDLNLKEFAVQEN